MGHQEGQGNAVRAGWRTICASQYWFAWLYLSRAGYFFSCPVVFQLAAGGELWGKRKTTTAWGGDELAVPRPIWLSLSLAVY